MMRYIFSKTLLRKASTLEDKKQAIKNYKGVWEDKTPASIRNEIHVIENWSNEIDKYLHREQLKSNEKLDILKGILNESI